MGYKHRNGSTPDHVNSDDSDDSSRDHNFAASDSTGKKKPKMNLSDSLDKYERKAITSARAGDIKGTEAASRKYAKFDNDYVREGAEGDMKAAQKNLDLVKKLGGYKAAHSGDMTSGGHMVYGSEEMNTTAVNSIARQRAKEKVVKEQNDIIKAKAKP